MMEKFLVWGIAYGVCPLVGGFFIWLKQGRYLTEYQPFAFLLMGPLTPLFALLPKSFYTSREQSQGKSVADSKAGEGR